MKKISIFALVLVLTAGLLTACRRPVKDEMTLPSTHATTPSTHATMPSTHATMPSTHATMPSTHATEPSTHTTQPHSTDGTDMVDPTDHSDAARRRRLPRY